LARVYAPQRVGGARIIEEASEMLPGGQIWPSIV